MGKEKTPARMSLGARAEKEYNQSLNLSGEFRAQIQSLWSEFEEYMHPRLRGNEVEFVRFLERAIASYPDLYREQMGTDATMALLQEAADSFAELQIETIRRRFEPIAGITKALRAAGSGRIPKIDWTLDAWLTEDEPRTTMLIVLAGTLFKHKRINLIEEMKSFRVQEYEPSEITEELLDDCAGIYERNYRDNEELQKILVRNFREISRFPSLLYTLECDGVVVAFNRFDAVEQGEDERPIIHFGAMNVSPDFRGYSVGSMFMNETLEREAQRGVMIAECDLASDIAFSYINQRGFVGTAIFRDWHGITKMDIERNPRINEHLRTRAWTDADVRNKVGKSKGNGGRYGAGNYWQQHTDDGGFIRVMRVTDVGELPEIFPSVDPDNNEVLTRLVRDGDAVIAVFESCPDVVYPEDRRASPSQRTYQETVLGLRGRSEHGAEGDSEREREEAVVQDRLRDMEIQTHHAAMERELRRQMEKSEQAAFDDALRDAEQRLERPLDDGQRKELAQRVQAGLEEIKRYFLTPGDDGRTALSHVADMYDSVPNAEPAAVEAHMGELIRLAFDQHALNPEQFVSHGFDHTISVVRAAREVLERNSVFVDSIEMRYGVRSDEARFLAETVAAFHDVGYPRLSGRPKVTHAVAGGMLMSSEHMRDALRQLVKLPTKRHEEVLLSDMRDAVLMHSADTVESQYDARIRTTRGSFLVTRDAVTDVYSRIMLEDVERGQGKARVIRIEVPSSLGEEERILLQREIGQAAARIGEEPPDVQVLATERSFMGRKAGFLREIPAGAVGMEFHPVEATQQPLQAIVRIADNMDITAERFSPAQRTPAFQGIVEEVGKLDAKQFEDKSLVGRIIDDALRKHPVDDADLELRVRRIALQVNPTSFRHFAGSLPVKEVRLKGAGMVVVVDREEYDRLNAFTINENRIRDGEVVGRTIRVGEYQISRTADALRSVTVAGAPISLSVVDIWGRDVPCVYLDQR